MHYIWPNGQGALLAGVERERPCYDRLLELLRSVPGSKASRSWVDRVNPFARVRAPPTMPLSTSPSWADTLPKSPPACPPAKVEVACCHLLLLATRVWE